MTSTDRPHHRLGSLAVVALVLVGAVVAPHARPVRAVEPLQTTTELPTHRHHPSLGTVELPPDAQGSDRGGIAARLRRGDDTPVPGDVFMLMGVEGADATAVVYDATPFRHDRPVAADSLESNLAAATLASELVGAEIERVHLTTAPGGGPSGGLAYVLAYLDMTTSGGFTAGLRVAATGSLESYGYVHPVLAVDEKVAAAQLAGVDTVFVPSRPLALGANRRVVGETARARFTGATLAEERRTDRYRAWGADRNTRVDVVVVRHVVDVAAYLCGAGSAPACAVEASIGSTAAGPAVPRRSAEPADLRPSTTTIR